MQRGDFVAMRAILPLIQYLIYYRKTHLLPDANCSEVNLLQCSGGGKCTPAVVKAVVKTVVKKVVKKVETPVNIVNLLQSSGCPACVCVCIVHWVLCVCVCSTLGTKLGVTHEN